MQIASPLTTEAEPILQWIEVSSSLSIPSFHLIGLPSPEVAEARERVRAAIEASDLEFPRRRVVINLSPASIRKRGTGSDLAMALAILLAARVSGSDSLRPCKIVASGELGLDGTVKPVGHVTRALYASWEAGAERVLLAPRDYASAMACLSLLAQAGIFHKPRPVLISVNTLAQAWHAVLHGDAPRLQEIPAEPGPSPGESWQLETPLLPLDPDLEKWILVAALGRHHLLLLGPRGSGKSHALEWLARVQPELDPRTRLKHLLIRELHQGPDAEFSPASYPIRRVSLQVRPFALTGGGGAGSGLKPGELSLAHGGLLLADEFPEWPRDSRETLREPLERGRITITRANGAVELPADFVLAATGNLCPCGGWPRRFPRPTPSPAGACPDCVCKDGEARDYLRRLSGPILDRVDIVRLQPTRVLPSNHWVGDDRVRLVRDRIARGRLMATSVWGAPPGRIPSSEVETFLRTKPRWISVGNLRSRHKIARVAMSLAIHECLTADRRSPEPAEKHFEEAQLGRFDASGVQG